MPLPALYCRFAQAIDKTARTDCVCSGAHCAAVGGFAALRMRRAPCGLRAPCRPRVWWHDRRPHTPCRGRRPRRPVMHRRNQQAADKTVNAKGLSFRGAKRRGNLAVLGRITGRSRRKRSCLPEIATAPSGPRNDKSEGIAPLNLCRDHCQSARRSLPARGTPHP